ncbi:peroxiredoxin [Chitinophaga skermanii]|uniref:Peroxiredoxin n=1 Tax=Chitinophaga skermanii TaxID=331697 RepID=A0A327QDX9_9BACT|nr:TlpA disulfide reductase family protein [Chitinophaga skermanii]RAI99846.1 peroxiredoxin [Chitinophaga skermanii]
MNKMLTVVLLLLTIQTFAQDQPIKKPKTIYIVGDSVVSKEHLNLIPMGSIKGMSNGVTEEKYAMLKEKLGDAVGIDRRFIVYIEQYSPGEQKVATAQPTSAPTGNKPSITLPSRKIEYVLKENDAAADFTVEMLTGEKVKMSDLKGKVVLVNFWATWCAPCIKEFYEIPEMILQPFKKEIEKGELVFLPISEGEKRELVEKTMDGLKKNGVIFNVALDPTKEVGKAYGTSSIPRNFLVDKNGVIRFLSVGFTEKNMTDLNAAIKKLLAQ